MQTRRGGSRIVFIFPVFGIAIKFPIIHFFEAIRQFFLRKRWRKWKYIKDTSLDQWNLILDSEGSYLEDYLLIGMNFVFIGRQKIHYSSQPTYRFLVF